MAPLSIHARWIVPVSRPPIENGRVIVEAGRIVSVEKAARQAVDIDYGDAVILPGLVNAHTHLELTRMRGRVPFHGSFADWLRGVVALQVAEGAEPSIQVAMGEGLDQSLVAGVTTIVDIGCSEGAASAWSSDRASIVGFFEALGMGPRRLQPHPRSITRAIADCEAAIRARSASEGPTPDVARCRKYGISPHAPYSTAPEVYQQAIDYVRRRDLPICTHLAETREEVEFLAAGTGPLRDLLDQLGLWDGSFSPPGCSPVEYADRLGLLECRPLLAHVNYVSDMDIQLLSRRQASVVYCPRTHRFFEHEPHRYREMLTAGINVCLGTDSLASNNTLSILDELRFLRLIDASTPSNLLLEMGTLHGARAVGLDSQIGSLEPGKRADIIIVPLHDHGANDPRESLICGTTLPIAVYAAGQLIMPPGRP